MQTGDMIRFVKPNGSQNSFFIREITGQTLWGLNQWCYKTEVIEVNNVPTTTGAEQVQAPSGFGGSRVSVETR